MPLPIIMPGKHKVSVISEMTEIKEGKKKGKMREQRIRYHLDPNLPCLQRLGVVVREGEKEPTNKRKLRYQERWLDRTVKVDGYEEEVRCYLFFCPDCAHHKQPAIHFVPSVNRLPVRSVLGIDFF